MNVIGVVPALPSAVVGLVMFSSGSASSSTMVPWPRASPIEALTAPDRLTRKVSSASSSASLATGTVIVCVVAPAVNVRVPLVVVKSAPAVAVPLAVA